MSESNWEDKKVHTRRRQTAEMNASVTHLDEASPHKYVTTGYTQEFNWSSRDMVT